MASNFYVAQYFGFSYAYFFTGAVGSRVAA